MAKSKRLGVSVFIVILTIIMAVSVVMTFAISYIFGNDNVSGKLFGSHIYIMETDDMYLNAAKKTVMEKGSAVIVEEEKTLNKDFVVLFKNGAREDVMRIREIDISSEVTKYTLSSDINPEKTYVVTGEKIVGKCVTNSNNLGAVISFFSSVPGIIVGMILPCFVILAMLIIKIVSMKKGQEEEEDYDEYDYEEDDEDDDDEEYEGFNGHKVKSLHSSAAGSPLFNPESDINPTDEFERKKLSIAKNFSQKGAVAKNPVNETRQAPKAVVEKFREAVDEKPRVPVAKKGSLVPEDSADYSNDKLAAIKASLSQQNAQTKSADTVKPVSADRTAKFSAIKEDMAPKKSAEPARPATRPAPKAPARPVSKPAPRPAAKPSQTSSNISSIDDLIKILEEEKKKL